MQGQHLRFALRVGARRRGLRPTGLRLQAVLPMGVEAGEPLVGGLGTDVKGAAKGTDISASESLGQGDKLESG